jgi:hypothetical protein
MASKAIRETATKGARVACRCPRQVARGIDAERPCSAEVGARGQRVSGQDAVVAGSKGKLTRADLRAMTEHPCSVTIVARGHDRTAPPSASLHPVVGRQTVERCFATSPRNTNRPEQMCWPCHEPHAASVAETNTHWLSKPPQQQTYTPRTKCLRPKTSQVVPGG